MGNNSEGADIRGAFSAVKRDINQVKRKLNQEMRRQESLAKHTGTLVAKQEFYNYLNNLGDRLDKLSEAAVNRRLLTKFKDDVKERITDIRDRVERRDNLAKEIKEIGILKNAIIELDGAKATRKEFKDFSMELGEHSKGLTSMERGKVDRGELAKVSQEVAALHKEKSDQEALNKLGAELSKLKHELSRRENLKERLKEIRKLRSEMEKISVRKASRDAFSALRDKVDVIDEKSVKNDRFISRMNTFDQRVRERLKSIDLLRKEINGIKDHYVNASDFRRRMGALTSIIKEKANNIEDLKREFTPRIDLEDLRRSSDHNEAEIKRMKDRLSLKDSSYEDAFKELRGSIKVMEKNYSPAKRVAQLEVSVKGLDKDLDKLSEILDQFITKGDMEDLSYQLDEVKSDKLSRAKFDKELKKINQKIDAIAKAQNQLRSSYKKPARTAKPAKKSKKGKFGKRLNSILDFFLEEEPKKR